MTASRLELLLRLHDGDDRCGCLRDALIAVVDTHSEDTALLILEVCLEQHPSGSSYYRRTR